MREKTVVLKFGGAAVAEPALFAHVARIIQKLQQQYRSIVTVVSAMQGMTDSLHALAMAVHPLPPRREYDMLVSAGERISISLLAMALAKNDIEAVSFTGSQSGIITCSRHTDARIIDVRPTRIVNCLAQGKIAIVAGFQGVSREKEITTLGRGGSDTTAVALGVALEASCVVYYKDVPGLFSADPKTDPFAHRYPTIRYHEARTIIRQGKRALLHPRSLDLAEKNQIPLVIRSFLDEESETVIQEPSTTRPSPLFEVEEGE